MAIGTAKGRIDKVQLTDTKSEAKDMDRKCRCTHHKMDHQWNKATDSYTECFVCDCTSFFYIYIKGI